MRKRNYRIRDTTDKSPEIEEVKEGQQPNKWIRVLALILFFGIPPVLLLIFIRDIFIVFILISYYWLFAYRYAFDRLWG